MLQVDLSTLRGPELRRLLDTTRARGQADLSYQILQEMAARRERSGGKAASRRSGEPRMIELNLGDPLDREEEREEEREAALAAPEADRDFPPLEIQREAVAVRRPETKPASGPPQRRALWLTLGFAAGMAVGVGLSWWAGGARYGLPGPAPAPVVAARAPDALALGPATPPPVVPAEPVAAAPSEASAPATPDVRENVPPPPADVAQDTASAVSPAPASPVARPEEAVSTEVARLATANAKGCAAEPTPADQAICGDPRLQRLQRDLRQAYAEALEAHADRTLLRERQLAWRDARNTISDPDRLAQLYQQRIRKLNAATAEALRQR